MFIVFTLLADDCVCRSQWHFIGCGVRPAGQFFFCHMQCVLRSTNHSGNLRATSRVTTISLPLGSHRFCFIFKSIKRDINSTLEMIFFLSLISSRSLLRRTNNDVAWFLMNGPWFFFCIVCGSRGRDRTYYRNRKERRERQWEREKSELNCYQFTGLALSRCRQEEWRKAESIYSRGARCINARRHCRHHHHFHHHRNKRLMTPKRHSIRQIFMKS